MYFWVCVVFGGLAWYLGVCMVFEVCLVQSFTLNSLRASGLHVNGAVWHCPAEWQMLVARVRHSFCDLRWRLAIARGRQHTHTVVATRTSQGRSTHMVVVIRGRSRTKILRASWPLRSSRPPRPPPRPPRPSETLLYSIIWSQVSPGLGGRQPLVMMVAGPPRPLLEQPRRISQLKVGGPGTIGNNGHRATEALVSSWPRRASEEPRDPRTPW